jgi:peptidoglycan/LPS O-acetylase OafA/YrhL
VAGNGTELADFHDGFPYFATFNGEYMHQETGTLFGHSWTLGIEEKFYIIWPFIMVFLWSRRTLAGIALAGILVFLVWLGENRELLIRGYAGLSFGAALAVAASHSQVLSARLRSHGTVYMAVVGIAIAYLFSLAFPHPYLWNVCIAFFAAGLIGSFWLGTGSWLGDLLGRRLLTAAGRLTYAIYLTHVLVMNAVLMVAAKLNVAMPWVVAFVLCYAASIAFAYVLHRMVEKPLIEIGRKVAKRPARPAVLRSAPVAAMEKSAA